MSLSDLASLATVASSVAVLASLIYLSLQMRQNAKHSRALIQQGRAALLCDLNLRQAELASTDGVAACYAGIPNVTRKDFVQFVGNVRAGLLSAEDTFLQYKQGLLYEEAYATFRGTMHRSMRSKGSRLLWRIDRASWSTEFQGFIDKIIADVEAEHEPSAFDQWNALAATSATPSPA